MALQTMERLIPGAILYHAFPSGHQPGLCTDGVFEAAAETSPGASRLELEGLNPLARPTFGKRGLPSWGATPGFKQACSCDHAGPTIPSRGARGLREASSLRAEGPSGGQILGHTTLEMLGRYVNLASAHVRV